MTSNQRLEPVEGLGPRLMALVWRRPADGIAERTRRRISLHIMPYLFFLYILAYLDRVNVAVAGLTMADPPSQGGMGFSLDVLGFGAGIFFWGYWILEIPSAVSVARWGARWVFMRILVLWGLCAALVGTIGTPFGSALFAWLPRLPEHAPLMDSIDGSINGLFGWAVHLVDSGAHLAVLSSSASFINHLPDTPRYQFYFLRFMLGFFEGGFFPSVIVYLSLWFRTEDRARAVAAFMSAIPIASILGMPICALILDVGWFGLPGWRWIFILEGIAPILAGFATLFFLPDGPTKAAWLPDDERAWLLGELERERHTKHGHGHWAWVNHLGLVLLLTAVYFCLNVTSYGLSMSMPAIIKSQTGLGKQVASYVAALPYVMALVAMFINGWHSDRTGERPWHVAVPLFLLGLGIWLTAACDAVPVLPAILMIVLVGTCLYAYLPAFWPIPTMFLGATAAASAIGFINMIGNLGSSVGPMVVGKAATEQTVPAASAGVVGLIGSPLGQGPLLATSTLALKSAHAHTSYAPALMKLVAWPIAAAVIIVLMGYWHRRTQRTPRPD